MVYVCSKINAYIIQEKNMLEIIKRKVTYYVTSETKSFTPVESFFIYHI